MPEVGQVTSDHAAGFVIVETDERNVAAHGIGRNEGNVTISHEPKAFRAMMCANQHHPFDPLFQQEADMVRFKLEVVTYGDMKQ